MKPLSTRKTCLMDPNEWELIFIDLHDLFEEKDERAPSYINWAIVEPLESILLEEYEKNGFTGIYNIGLNLLVIARQAIGQIRSEGADPREPAWAINAAWAAWLKEVVATTKTRGRDGGRKGGSAPKRKPWAEAAAARLAMVAQGCTQDQAWEMLPESTTPWEFEFDEYDALVYRDEDVLVGSNGVNQLGIPLKKSTFLKNYFKKAQKSGQ